MWANAYTLTHGQGQVCMCVCVCVCMCVCVRVLLAIMVRGAVNECAPEIQLRSITRGVLHHSALIIVRSVVGETEAGGGVLATEAQLRGSLRAASYSAA